MRSNRPAPRLAAAWAPSAPGAPGAGASRSNGEGVLDWSDIYERLARRPDRPDPSAREELTRRVRAWATMRASGLHRDAVEEVTQDTCAEVWRTFSLARGGTAFEGFVQGRFVETLRRVSPPQPPGDLTPQDPPARLVAALDELRARNPRHHRAIELIYQDQATPQEAADELAVDAWAFRSMLARARRVLAQSLTRSQRQQRPGDGRRPAARTSGKPRRPGRR